MEHRDRTILLKGLDEIDVAQEMIGDSTLQAFLLLYFL